jgi:TatD DNase family protein
MPKYFDIHSHLNSSKYENDLEEVINRLEETETHTIVIGTDPENSQKAIEIAEKHEGIYASIGVHPVDDPKRAFDLEKFEEMVKSSKVVAIGECGMDFFHAKKAEDYDRQAKLFMDQIEFAVKHDKPLMIHSRSAEEEVVSFLEPLKEQYGEKLRGNVHFFAGTPEVAERFFRIGFSISFTGVITFTHDYDEVIKKAPLNMLHAETDAPYVAPVPYRGQRNEPSYASEVYKRIAEIRGEDFETIRTALVQNALNMVGY